MATLIQTANRNGSSDLERSDKLKDEKHLSDLWCFLEEKRILK